MAGNVSYYKIILCVTLSKVEEKMIPSVFLKNRNDLWNNVISDILNNYIGWFRLHHTLNQHKNISQTYKNKFGNQRCKVFSDDIDRKLDRLELKSLKKWLLRRLKALNDQLNEQIIQATQKYHQVAKLIVLYKLSDKSHDNNWCCRFNINLS
jgi:hypothetical protein